VKLAACPKHVVTAVVPAVVNACAGELPAFILNLIHCQCQPTFASSLFFSFSALFFRGISLLWIFAMDSKLTAR
jgi:hypothetical protein